MGGLAAAGRRSRNQTGLRPEKQESDGSCRMSKDIDKSLFSEKSLSTCSGRRLIGTVELSDHLTLDVVGLALPIFQALFPYDVYLDLTDRERTLFVVQARSFHLDVAVGDPVRPGSMAAEMLATGQPAYARATAETTMFGFPYIAKGIPLTQRGSVIGTLSLAMNVDDLEQMESLSKRLLGFLEQSNAKVRELSASAQELAATAAGMIKQGEITQQESVQMYKTLTEVQKLARQSHVLSINTSIEASRLGQSGRSFLVIAQNMQNLAAVSLESSRAIDEGLNRFQADLQATLDSLSMINEVVQRQASDINSLAEASSEVAQVAAAFGRISLFQFGS